VLVTPIAARMAEGVLGPFFGLQTSPQLSGSNGMLPPPRVTQPRNRPSGSGKPGSVVR
jgi:hypothetical protein